MKTQYLALPALLVLSACASTEPDPEPPFETGIVQVEVIDYSPAPGQFVNTMPVWNSGDSRAQVTARAQESLNRGELITLGAWGGSVTVKLRHPITDKAGADMRVLGNAFLSGTLPDGRPYGSAEPGIIYLMVDTNGNGLPDEVWHRVPGTADGSAKEAYTVTYAAPEPGEERIRYTCGDGTQGTLAILPQYHAQPYFPGWVDASELTFSGIRLPDNGVYDAQSGYYRLAVYDGYADCRPNADIRSAIDIASVGLQRVDFVRIVTGVLQDNGQTGECSTEVGGIEAL